MNGRQMRLMQLARQKSDSELEFLIGLFSKQVCLPAERTGVCISTPD